MANKTAVEWLEEKITNYNYERGLSQMRKHIRQAIQVERIQCLQSWNNGYEKGKIVGVEKNVNPVQDSVKYYNETYGEHNN